MENRLKIFFIILVLLIVAAAIGGYFLGLSQGKNKLASQSSQRNHTVVTCIQDFNLEQKKTDAGVITNPMEKLPETNPFDKVKTNPFE